MRSITRSKRMPRDFEAKYFDLDMGQPFYDVTKIPRSLQQVGRDDALDSNVVMSPVFFIMRLFTEAQAVIERRMPGEDGGEQRWQYAADHALELLIDQPNDFYGADELWKATLLSYVLDGNAYWIKTRNAFGNVIQLWYVPHWLIQPRWPDDGTTFISHYEYSPGGQQIRLAPRDVVHFRFGLDPRNDGRMGFSPLKTLLHEVYTDNEAATFSADILVNHGVPGMMLSPADGSVKWTDAQALQLKADIKAGFTGRNRGSTLVMAQAMKASQYGFSPNELTLGNLRDIAEERVCAVLGIPAAIVGFGSGLQSTKVGATMRELVKLTWVSCLSPMQKTLARQLTAKLLPDFVSQTRRFRVKFDTTEVSGFQEDENEKSNRVLAQVAGGLLRVDRGQEALGLEVDPTMRVYQIPTNVNIIDEYGEPVAVVEAPKPEPKPAGADDELLAAVASRANGNGNGNGSNDG